MTALRLSDICFGAVRVTALDADAGSQQRLIDLGLHVGSTLSVLERDMSSGVLVAVGDGRIAVDPATARLVRVTRLDETLKAMTIGDLRPGERARIVAMGKGMPGYRQRLMAMGLTPGVEFLLTRVAPLGDPVEIQVRGFSMSLRKAEAELLAIEKLP
jgi:ferrous iron transport protein A